METLSTSVLLIRLINNQVRQTKLMMDGKNIPKRELIQESELVDILSARLDLDKDYIIEKLAE